MGFDFVELLALRAARAHVSNEGFSDEKRGKSPKTDQTTLDLGHLTSPHYPTTEVSLGKRFDNLLVQLGQPRFHQTLKLSYKIENLLKSFQTLCIGQCVANTFHGK
jgi:hypothetical protein